MLICIPSYRRSTILLSKTLKSLQDFRICYDMIRVFVVREEFDEYRRVVPINIQVIVGVAGLVPQRNFIEDMYPDEDLVFMDDDLEDIVWFQDTECLNNCVGVPELITELENMFFQCKSLGLRLWGIYPVFNRFFAEKSKKYTTDLRYIIGCLYGVCAGSKEANRLYDCSGVGSEKEDVERTLLYFKKDGGVLRNNWMMAKTKFYAKGGLQNESGECQARDCRKERGKLACQELSRRFPDYGRIAIRKNGIHEFRLKRNTTKSEFRLKKNVGK